MFLRNRKALYIVGTPKSQLRAFEAAFRTAKSDIGLRPIYHQKTERVEAHLLVCFLSLALWRTLEAWMSTAGLGSRAGKLLEAIATIRCVDVVPDGAGGDEDVGIRNEFADKPECSPDAGCDKGLRQGNRNKLKGPKINTLRSALSFGSSSTASAGLVSIRPCRGARLNAGSTASRAWRISTWALTRRWSSVQAISCR